MVYIAGLDIHDVLRRSPLSHNQGVEGLVWLTTFSGFYRGVRHFRRAHKHAHRIAPPSGANIGDNVPKPLLARTLEPIVHGVLFIAPVTYLVGTAFGKLEQPEWFVRFALPDVDLTVGQFAALKTVACVANIAVQAFMKRVRKAIAAASESEKATIPTEGPYSVIRHPLSVGSMLSQATLAIMWWNAVPLATAALTGIYLISYTSYEEKRREKDLIHGAQYQEYKKRVTSKFIPGVW